MYKVFVNDKPIILTSSLKKEENFPVFIFKNILVDEIIYRLKGGKLKGVYLFSTNLEEDWQQFCNNFKLITAAGGLVVNSKKEILFIYRGEKWDLPKGRIEVGESIEDTAVREVEEECGIDHLKLHQFLLKTYHIFYQGSEIRLKQTYWYLMYSNYTGKLTPQLEEGITEVVFKNEVEIKEVFKNTYANIILVYEAYKAN
ncbi:NUDIX domain-containing protein [Tenacibaculum adriaticum]|uniref:NUDIX domain-containing protein n=2 Tax=Tenacibaculum adriaticum TaxID=413713 RepID=A0A5S5DKI1_9FLAO|nr:NUDIX domain-containing protein [Tenacibaculum adriaticum]